MLALTLAGAMTVAAWNTPTAQWSVQLNSTHTQIRVATSYSEQSERGNWNEVQSQSFDVSEMPSKVPGLTVDQLRSNGTHVYFKIPHDAGTLQCDGWAHGDAASGDFKVVLNPQFALELQRRGIGTPTAEQQRELVFAGGDYAYLATLTSQGFERPDVAQFLRLLQHGVSSDYLKGMAALRLSPHSIDTILRARDHGVTPEYARALIAGARSPLTITDLIRARDHGVSAEYMRGMKDAGFAASVDDLIRMRDHGVSPDYIAGLRRRGYTGRLSVDDVIRLRDHGI